MGQKDPFSIENGIGQIEDCLLNLQALISFGLHQIENSEPDEFRAMQNQWCTMMYLLQDQVKAAQKFNGHIGHAANRGSASEKEAHH